MVRLHSLALSLLGLRRPPASDKVFFACAMQVLQLEDIRNETIGDEDVRGISGGQRKRVNVGLELVADPALLFLDEPTSGLDSTSSRLVVAALQQVWIRASPCYWPAPPALLSLPCSRSGFEHHHVIGQHLRPCCCCPAAGLVLSIAMLLASTSGFVVAALQQA